MEDVEYVVADLRWAKEGVPEKGGSAEDDGGEGGGYWSWISWLRHLLIQSAAFRREGRGG